MTEIMEVPIKEGYTTYVTYGEDTLAVANEPISILIPKQSKVSTKASSDNEIKIDFGTLQNIPSYSNYWQAVMFEDTEDGDYDYNDLIIHVKNKGSNIWNSDDIKQTIEIQPIALGSQKIIKLGCLLGSEAIEVIFSNDVRRDLFQGVQGFINTENEATPIRYKLSPTSISNYQVKTVNALATIAWFIEVDGKRYYAITPDDNYKDYNMLNPKGMPYGLITMSHNGTFDYPQEKTTIFEVYPDFKAWYNGKKKTFEENKVTNLVYKYCYSKILGEDGKFHKIWDYQDLETTKEIQQ